MEYPSYFNSVWPNRNPLPPSWLTQSLAVTTQHPLGIVQPHNGPCGVLACVNAILIARRMDAEGTCDDKMFSDEELAAALTEITLRCRPSPDAPSRCVLWKDVAGGEVVETQLAEDAVGPWFVENIGAFKSEGGAVLIMYCAVSTRTVPQLETDAMMHGGELPLVYGVNHLCTSELMTLLLLGDARGNVAAYLFGAKQELSPPSKVGLLSRAELETGVPLLDGLKSPSLPVWVLHGGDHFTVLFNPMGAKVTTKDKPPFKLTHWNGLPPAGPRLTTFTISGGQVAEDAPAEQPQTYFKPVAGEIEDVVQAHPEDKKSMPEEWDKWRYEVVLAIDDPSVTGPKRPDSDPPKIFEQGEMIAIKTRKDITLLFQDTFQQEVENGATPTAAAAHGLRTLKDKVQLYSKWRCAECYRKRFSTMFFGENVATAEVCKNCKKKRSDAGWSIWLQYKDMPPEWQKKLDNNHAPKLLRLLRTKWPECDVSDVSGFKELGLPSV